MSTSGLTDDEVLRDVRLLVGRPSVAWSRHAEQRMAERGISKVEVKRCLQLGHFDERPTLSNRPGPIEYSFRMVFRVDGETIAVAGSLVPSTRVVVITAFHLT